MVAGGNPSTTPNPGFEFEVVLASNFEVSIYDHRGKPSGGGKIWSGSADQFSQRAVAASTYSNNPDYFYDFYVPLSAFPTTGPDLLTASTPLRMSGITITSAQSGITGSVSDVGGVNFASYNYSKQAAWNALINTFPATSLNQLRAGEFPKIAATPPVVSSLIQANSTSISGTSAEAAGSLITVFRNGTSIGTTTVSANGTWTLSGLSSTMLQSGNIITATVTPSNKTVSALSAPVTVVAGICTSTPAPVLTGLTGGTGNTTRQFVGSTTLNQRQRITIYNTSGTVIGTHEFTPSGAGPTYSWTTPAFSVNESNYYATAIPLSTTNAVSGCESLRSNQLCFRNGQNPGVNTETVSITSVTYDNTSFNSTNSATWFEAPANLTTISGTVAATASVTNTTVVLFINAVEQSQRMAITTSTTAATNWSITIPAGTLKPSDIVNVRTTRTLTGGGNISCPNSFSSASNLLTVQATTTPPTINAPDCGRITTLTGTSAEPAGTVLQFYTGGTAGARNGTLVTQSGNTTPITATVTAQGTWVANFSPAAGGGIPAGTTVTARAKAPRKVRSVNSASVSGALPLPIPAGATFTINPITAPASTIDLVNITGTGPASTSTMTYEVSLNVDGTLYPAVATTASGTWELRGLSGLEIFPGAVVTATFTNGASACPSAPITSTVQCRALTSTFTTTLSASSICYNGTVNVTLGGSEKGVSYVITNNGVPTGASVLGTGGPLTLTSGPLSASSSTLSVRAVVPGSTCPPVTGIGGNKSVTVLTAPAQPTSLAASVPSGCSSVTTNVTLNGPSANTTYQLINRNTGATLSPSVTVGPSAPSSITLASNLTLYATTELGVLITPSGNQCTSLSDRTTTVTVNQGPLLRRAVTIDKPTPCAGEQVNISVATEFNSTYTYTIRDDAGIQVGTSFTGTGEIVSRTTSYPNGITSSRNFYVEVTGGCASSPVRLATTVTATPSSTPVTANAGSNQTVCGLVTLNANNASPGVGTWTKTGGPAGGTITEPMNPRTTVTGLPSGVHTFTWTIVTSCGQSTPVTSQSSVSVTVNCPAEYIITPPRFVNEYKAGDILATATDSDGGIRSAAVAIGTLPTWAELQSNGNIVIRQGTPPTPGEFSFTVRTTDATGSTTDSPLTIRIYGQAPIIVPLPVELVYFTATVRNNQAHLEWLTASELDNDRFEVERSLDARSFEKVGTVKGKGTTSLETKYTFTDRTPVQGTVYYRLKQVDTDGQFAYSNVIAVNAKGLARELATQAYPNPFQDVIKVTLMAPEAQEAVMTIYDMNGRRVMNKDVQLDAGVNRLELNLEQLQSGMYILKVVGQGMESTNRIMKN
ncbi:Por secretion system C-terminal sorting domain-containing protein [Pontibacter indicus]|uniref:Por secretion system C-terminal sorting domain-containing protein n=1 Tax=Pontibacter indicus TaxID=1317125 RepID=A0A1R3W7L8_9BACT|nr:Por secretion system C-terminal sorting domain-containing protein [Pontibacter indicus]